MLGVVDEVTDPRTGRGTTMAPATGTIPVVCACGKTGHFAAALAGRRARCGRCQALLRIPTFVPNSAVAPPAPAPPRPAARPRWRRKLVGMGLLAAVVAGIALGRWSAGVDLGPVARLALPAGPEPAADRLPAPPAVAPAPIVRAQSAGPWGRRRPAALAAVEAYLRHHANDPASLEVVEHRAPRRYDGAGDLHPADEGMYVMVRGRNELGALAVRPCLAYLLRGEVVHVMAMGDPLAFEAEAERIYGPPAAPTASRRLNDGLIDMIRRGPVQGPREMPVFGP